MNSSKLKSFLTLFSRLLRCKVSQFVFSLICFYLADLQLVLGRKIYYNDVRFYPSCFFPHVDEKHFLKILSSLNSIFTVSVCCLVFAVTRNCLVLTYFCSCIPNSFCSISAVSFLCQPCALKVWKFVDSPFSFFHLFYSTFYIKLLYLGHPEFFLRLPISYFSAYFFCLRLKKQPMSNTISVCVLLDGMLSFLPMLTCI